MSYLRVCLTTITLITVTLALSGCFFGGKETPSPAPTTASPRGTLPPAPTTSATAPPLVSSPQAIQEAYPPPALHLQAPTPSIPGYPAPVLPNPTPRQPIGGGAVEQSKLTFAFFIPFMTYLFSPPSDDNLLQNGDFEQLGGWSCLGGCRLSPRINQGRTAVFVDGRTSRWNGPVQNVSDNVRQNGRYASSVWVRSPDSELRVAWMVLEVTTSTGIEYFSSASVPLIDGEWQQLLHTLNLQWAGDFQQAVWRIETDPASATLLVDDASLVELAAPSPLNEITTVEVFPQRLKQTIGSLASGNWRHGSAYIDEPLDDIGRFNLDNLDHRAARVMVNLNRWQLTSDGNVNVTDDMADSFLMMEEFQTRDMELILAIRDVPDWLVLNANFTGQRVLDPEAYDEAADLLIGWLTYARDNHNLDIPFLSFNEPDLGADTFWSPEAMADFIQVAGPRLRKAGLDTLFLLGDCSSVKNCLHFSQTVWAEQSTRPYIGAIAVHTWDRPQPPDIDYEALGAFAASTEFPLLATEVGWDSEQWRQGPDMAPFSSWEHALRSAQIYSRMLKLTGASSTFFWQMLGDDFPTNDGEEGYPIFLILQEMSEIFVPGAFIVETSPNDEAVYSVAALVDGRLIVSLINGSEQPRPLTVTGLLSGTYQHRRIREDGGAETAEFLATTNGQLALSLEGESIHWLIQE